MTQIVINSGLSECELRPHETGPGTEGGGLRDRELWSQTDRGSSSQVLRLISSATLCQLFFISQFPEMYNDNITDFTGLIKEVEVMNGKCKSSGIVTLQNKSFKLDCF